MTSSLEALLFEGLQGLTIKTDIAPLVDYLHLLQKWNKTYNLTAIRELNTMISGHLLDSLAISQWIAGPRVIDVGTGAGFPGLPLAICYPTLQVTLLDSNGKKICFLEEVKRTLGLKNINIIYSRAENYQPEDAFDTVTSRAVGNLSQLINWTRHFLQPQGLWLAMKGRYPSNELASVLLPYQVHSYKVPGVEGERCCVTIKNATKE